MGKAQWHPWGNLLQGCNVIWQCFDAVMGQVASLELGNVSKQSLGDDLHAAGRVMS